MPESFIQELDELPPDAAIAADHRNPRRRNREAQQEDEPEVGVLVHPEPRHELGGLILHSGVSRVKRDRSRVSGTRRVSAGARINQQILDGLRAIQIRDQLEEVWSISRLQPQQGRCILNFYGPPGTGKTRAAQGVAHRLGQPLYQVDYSAVISKYLGDTAKHIKRAFERASHHGAVLFLDEADSLLSKRVSLDESCATSINQNRNCLMQELDRFEGVVVMTTNLFGNYDDALLRRVQRHIEFRLPDASMRRDLLALHLPNPERVKANLRNLAKQSRGLSGGDILNICLNAIHAGSRDPDPAKWVVTEEMLLREIKRAKAAKEKHAGRRGAGRRRIGFGA